MNDFVDCPNCGHPTYDIDTGCSLCGFVVKEIQEERKTKLRTWQTAQSAYGFVFKHQTEFWRLAMLPMAIFCVVIVVVYSTIGVEFANSVLGGGLADLLLTILVLPFIVAWHRLILVGPEAVAGHRGLVYGRREGMFFVWIIIFTILFLVLILPFIMIPILTILEAEAAQDTEAQADPFAMILPAMIIFLVTIPVWRLSFVFPSLAIDRGASIKGAWSLTRGNTFRLAFAMSILIILPVRIVFEGVADAASFLLTQILGPETVTGPAVALNWAVTLFERFFMGALVASFLSLTYLILTTDDNAAD